MSGEEREPYEGLDPELAVLALRADLKTAEAKAAAAAEELEALKTAMRPSAGAAAVISLADLEALPLDERVSAWRKVARGEIRIDPSGPRTPKAVRFMTAKQIAALPLDERYAAHMGVLRGEIRVLD